MRAPGIEGFDSGLHDSFRGREVRLADLHMHDGSSLRFHGAGAGENIHHMKWLDP